MATIQIKKPEAKESSILKGEEMKEVKEAVEKGNKYSKKVDLKDIPVPHILPTEDLLPINSQKPKDIIPEKEPRHKKPEQKWNAEPEKTPKAKNEANRAGSIDLSKAEAPWGEKAKSTKHESSKKGI